MPDPDALMVRGERNTDGETIHCGVLLSLQEEGRILTHSPTWVASEGTVCRETCVHIRVVL